MVLATDDPTFATWDQDATAVPERYAEQDPVTVAGATSSSPPYSPVTGTVRRCAATGPASR